MQLFHGDCRDVIKSLPACSVDSVVTDPPYSLVSIQKRFGAANAAPAKDRDGLYQRASRGFMGKTWDTGETAFDSAFWAEVLRVLKPGGHVLAFGGTRTEHRLTCAIEDAGFEIRDKILWLCGQGFPKSKGLKPACELVTMARKPCDGTRKANAAKWGTGELNIEACRVELAEGDWLQGGLHGDYDRMDTGAVDAKWGFKRVDRAPGLGRWPANVIHDGTVAFPHAPGQQRSVGPEHGAKDSVNCYGDFGPRDTFKPRGDSGSAARFFYCAKATAKDRRGSKHPTVKPISLLRYLCRLITPPGGVVLDPFAGSGTTGEAAIEEGFVPWLIEREDEYFADIQRRMQEVVFAA